MPATGFAMGDAVITHLIEQTPHARALKDAALASAGCDIFMVQASESRRAEVLAIASALRDQGYSVDLPSRSPKSTDSFRRPLNPAPTRP